MTHMNGMESSFAIIAEPNRRTILSLLASSECSVGEIERQLRMSQTSVSKHLRVLREVGAVEVREDGRRRLYRLNGEALRPIHDWVKEYEQTWSQRFEQLDAVLEDLKRKDDDGDGNDE